MSTNAPSHDRSIDDPVTRSYRENDFRGSLLEQLDDATLTWLASGDQAWDDVVKIERVRRENPAKYATMMAAVDDDVKRRVIGILTLRDTATYREFQEYIRDVGLRTIKNHVWDLRDAEILSVGDGSPAIIRFADKSIDLLARDALSFHPAWNG